MMIKFRESGHPVFRATSQFYRVLRSKGGGNLSIYFCADEGTIENVFRTLIFCYPATEQSQICVTNANPAMLEQGDLFWWDNLTHCLCPQV